MAKTGIGDLLYTTTAEESVLKWRSDTLGYVYGGRGFGMVGAHNLINTEEYARTGNYAFPAFEKSLELGITQAKNLKGLTGKRCIYHGRLKNIKANQIVVNGANGPAFAFSFSTIRDYIGEGDEKRLNRFFVYSCIMGRHQYEIVLKGLQDEKSKRELIAKRGEKIFSAKWSFFLHTTQLKDDIELFDKPKEFWKFWYMKPPSQ